MMCTMCVKKVASTFKVYNICRHIDKISKINKIIVWVSTGIFNCYVLSWNFYRF